MSPARDTVILKHTIVGVQWMKAVDVRPTDVPRFTAWGSVGMLRRVVPARPPITPFAFVMPLPIN
jgi:hypothetical protein